MLFRLALPPIEKLRRLLNVDKALLWGLLGKLITAFAGPVTAGIIGVYFSPELQGYHYTFLSLMALQIFVELGLTGVIVNFASHEWAKLSFNKLRGIDGDQRALSRLSSLAIFSFRWFAVAAVTLVVLLIIAGFWFFSAGHSLAPQVHWQAPWVALCLITGINTLLVPAWAILQGCAQIQSYYFFRLLDVPLRSLAMWIAILAGAGLWAAVIGSCISATWAIYLLRRKFHVFFTTLFHFEVTEEIKWKQEILPLQWRITLSWMSGYFMFSLFTPALFHFQGPVVAGQMGMTWSLITGISGLAGTWTQVKVPDLGSMVARRKLLSLDRVVCRAALTSAALALVGEASLYAGLLFLAWYDRDLRGKLLPMTPIVYLMAAEVLHQISLAQSSYLRAFKKEPFLIMSVVLGLSVGTSVVVCAKLFSVDQVALSYLIAIIIALAWGTRILIKFRLAAFRNVGPYQALQRKNRVG